MGLPGRICFITGAGPLIPVVTAVLDAGIRWVQYRDKNRTRREIFLEALKVRDLTARFGACFIVNDHADIALAVEADGVHLGQDDLPLNAARTLMGSRMIGISTHSPTEAMEAARGGADYIGFGPIFPTATKDAGSPKGPGALSHIRSLVSIPIVAIGGIKAVNARLVLESGCDAVAVSSGLIESDPGHQARLFLEALARR